MRATGIERAGRDWSYDPLISVVGSVDDLHADHELPMVAGASLQDEGYMLTDITVPPWWFGMDAVLAGRPDRVRAYRRSLSIMVKIRDELSGEITHRGGPGKRLTDGDKNKLRAGRERARRILERAGARHIWATGCAAVHPGATAKVGDVVDSDLQTEIGGLYVCDASVIPVPWGLPPSMTVLALAKKLTRQLTDAPARHPLARDVTRDAPTPGAAPAGTGGRR